MNTKVPPLLCRRPLLPGESLISYLHRLAVANGYTPPAILARFCRRYLADHGRHDNLEHPQHPETFALFAALTGCPPWELADASSHFFAQSFILPPQATTHIHLTDGTSLCCLRPQTRPRYLWPANHAQFCPYCLQEAIYHRRIWLLKDIFGCVKHQCILVNHCEYCGGLIAIQDIACGHCPKCNTPLTKMTTEAQPLSPLGLLAQQTLHAWWRAIPSPIAHTEWALPEQPAGTLYRLFSQLRNSIEIRRVLNHRLARTLANQHLVQSQVFKALVDWPVGFYEFLQDCLNYEVGLHSYLYGYTFSQPAYLKRSSLLTFWACDLPFGADFDFVREVVAQFLVAQDLQIVGLSRCMRLRINVSPEREQLARITRDHRIDLLKAMDALEALIAGEL